MKIKSQLPQFTGERVLIIAVSKQNAQVYEAKDGFIEKLKDIEIESPYYTDREGFFMKSGSGKQLGSGSVYESDKHQLWKQLVKELSVCLKTLGGAGEFDGVYMFMPMAMKNVILAGISDECRRKIRQIRAGIFIGKHPFEYLEKIMKGRTRKLDPRRYRSEVRKLMDKENALKEAVPS